MKATYKITALSLLFAVLTISIVGPSPSFASHDFDADDYADDFDADDYADDFGTDLDEEFEQRLDELDLQYESIHREFGFSLEDDLSESQQIKFDIEIEKLYDLEDQIYDEFDIVSEHDYENLSSDQRNSFDDSIERIDLQYAKIYEEFGIVEPELSEEEYEQFEQRLDELDLQYELLFDEFDIDEYGLDEDENYLDEELFGSNTESDSDVSDLGEMISNLEDELKGKQDRIVALEQKVDDLEGQIQSLQQIMSEQLNVIFEWVTNQ